jgi:hypothetical protein
MTENCRVYNMKFGKKISLEEFRGILSWIRYVRIAIENMSVMINPEAIVD